MGLICSALAAQQTTIVNHFRTDTTGRGLQGLQLISSEEHRIVINYYEPAPEKEIDRLGQLLSSALTFYIDQSVSVRNGKVELRKPRKEMMRDMNEIVRQAIRHYQFREKETFKGFSDEVARKIDEVGKLDLAQRIARTPQPGMTRAQTEFFVVQEELNDLKRKVNREVGAFGTESLLVFAATESALIDEATRDSLLRSLYFDQNQTLRPVFLNEGMAELSLLKGGDQSELPVRDTSPAVPDEFTARILSMLERNDAKLDAMQDQIDQLRADQMRQWQQMQEARHEQMQAQINDLRGMVVDLMRMNTAGVAGSDREIFIPLPGSTGNTVFNIPSTIHLYFARGSNQLSANGVLALNEVVDILARNPGINVMITGSADRTGDPVRNLMLSQERATSVKKFLRKSGLGDDRFITRYLGDSNSEAESAGDRRVTLEFIR